MWFICDVHWHTASGSTAEKLLLKPFCPFEWTHLLSILLPKSCSRMDIYGNSLPYHQLYEESRVVGRRGPLMFQVRRIAQAQCIKRLHAYSCQVSGETDGQRWGVFFMSSPSCARVLTHEQLIHTSPFPSDVLSEDVVRLSGSSDPNGPLSVLGTLPFCNFIITTLLQHAP